MKSIIIALSLFILTACSTTHNHYHISNDDAYFHHEVSKHSHIDKGDHIVVVIKHKRKLNKKQKQRLRHWCHRHYKHHKKRIKCQFVLG